jgi:hypothetical protein
MHKVPDNYSSCTGGSSENIYVAAAAVEAPREKMKERQDETQFTTKIGGTKLFWLPVIFAL